MNFLQKMTLYSALNKAVHSPDFLEKLAESVHYGIDAMQSRGKANDAGELYIQNAGPVIASMVAHYARNALDVRSNDLEKKLNAHEILKNASCKLMIAGDIPIQILLYSGEKQLTVTLSERAIAHLMYKDDMLGEVQYTPAHKLVL